MKTRCFVLFAACAALLSSHALAQEGGSATVVPIAVNGDPAARFSLVVMSDSYTAADLPKYRRHFDKHFERAVEH